MGVERGDDVLGARSEQQLVVRQRIGALVAGRVDRHTGMALLGERQRHIGLGQDAVDRRFGSGAVGHAEQRHHGRCLVGRRHVARHGLDRDVEHGEGNSPVEPGGDVGGPADFGVVVGQHLFDVIAELVIQRRVELQALDRREAPEHLAQGRILLGGRIQSQLNVERSRGRDVRGASADRIGAAGEEEAAGRGTHADGQDGDDADDGLAPGGGAGG